MKRQNPEPKECQWCGTLMHQREDETLTNFKNKKHCSQKCNAQHREARRADRKRSVNPNVPDKREAE